MWIWIAPALGLLVLLYLFCLAPNTGRRAQMKPFEAVFIAHRGLFDNREEWPENSLPAFRRAVEAGYGIELDVQLTADRRLVVFHDESLKRMCGVDKLVRDCTYEELRGYPLLESGQRIPLLREVLEVVGGRVPLIVEVKAEGDWRETNRVLAEMMAGYPGLYCMESFHPLAVAWYRRHCPQILRGQLATDFFREGGDRPWMERLVLINLLLNWRARPDFIAFDHRYANRFSYRLCRSLFPVVNAAWTIRSQEELERAKKTFQVFIFDSFVPKP